MRTKYFFKGNIDFSHKKHILTALFILTELILTTLNFFYGLSILYSEGIMFLFGLLYADIKLCQEASHVELTEDACTVHYASFYGAVVKHSTFSLVDDIEYYLERMQEEKRLKTFRFASLNETTGRIIIFTNKNLAGF